MANRKNYCIQATLSLLSFFLCTPLIALHADNQLPANDQASFETMFNKLSIESKELKEFIGVVQMALGAFGYGTGPFDGTMDNKTITAFQQYQKHRGLKVTTKLDAVTVKTLMEDFDEWMKQIPYLPPLSLLLDAWDNGYVWANGTWVIEQDRMAFPMQTTRIQCYRESKECVAATAQLTGENGYLSSDIERYVIERWDKHEIVTAPKDYQCVRYVVRILKAQKSVTASRIKINDKGLCKEAMPEVNVRMEDGMKVRNQLSEERGEKIKRFMQLPFFVSDRDK